MCDFFNLYLSDRVQSVRYAGYTSEPLQVTSGVPEGSVIGPLLFVIFINDLLTSLPANTVMAYADDVTLVAYGQSEAEAAGALQVLLNCVNEWSTRNALFVNTNKSKWMLMSSVLKHSAASTATTDTCQRTTLKFSTVPLERVDTVRLLGVQHTDTSSWNAHISTVCKKINCMLGAIRRAGRCANANVRHRLFSVFVMPRLLYCLPVWGNCNETSSHMVNNTLKRALRTITGDSSANFSKPFYNSYGLLPFRLQLQLSNVRLVHRLLHSGSLCTQDNKCALYLHSGRSTCSCSSYKLNLVKVKKSTNTLCFPVGAAKHWNKLPFNVSSIMSFNHFQTAVVNFILNALM